MRPAVEKKKKEKRKNASQLLIGHYLKAAWIITRTKMVKSGSMRNGLSSEGDIRLITTAD